MRTSIPKNNFSSGQIDRDLKARYDLPIFQNGHEISRNFFHTIKGDCYFRPGFEYLEEIGYAALYEFKFSQEQAYLLVFRIQYIEFWTYDENGEFVQVLDDNDEELTLVHPWGTEVFNLNMTQNCDVLYINHNDGGYPEYQLKRTASNAFTLEVTTYTNTGTASLSSTSKTENHGFPYTCAFYENRMTRCSSTKFPTYLYGSKGGNYNDITVGTNTNDGYQFDLAEANSKALWLVSGVNSLLVGTAEGILTVNGGSVSKAITPTDISAKLSCRDGVSSVKPVHKDNSVFFVSSNKRQLYMFEYDVLMEQFKATNLSKGNYEITKGGIKKLANKFDRFGLIYALCGGRLLSICFSADEAVNSWSEFITDGEFIDICTVTRPDGDYDLFANVKRTINGTTRYSLERLTETIEFSRFEDFVSEVPKTANEADKLEIKKEDKNVFHRKIAEELRECNYLDCSMRYSGLRNQSFTFDPDTNEISLDVTNQQNSNVVYNGTFTDAELSNGFVKLTLSSSATTPDGITTTKVGIYSEDIQTDLSSFDVASDIYNVKNQKIYNGRYDKNAVTKTINNVVYKEIELASKVNLFNGKVSTKVLYYTGTLADNSELYYLLTSASSENETMVYVGKVDDNHSLALYSRFKIYADVLVTSEGSYLGKILSLDDDDIVIGFYDNAFKVSDVGKRIWVKTKTGKEYGSFDITEFVNDYNIKVKPLIMPTSLECDEWYLSATVFSGLEHLEGETVSVVGNGGYIGDFEVQNGMIDISSANVNKVGSAVIGLKYKGILKSTNLGINLQGTQTFSNMKNIYKVGLDLSFSAGCMIGSNLYDLNEVQDFNPEGLYDLPPLPMDEYREVNYSDDYAKDKHYFVVQDSPLPLHLMSVIPYYKHVPKV